MALPRVNMGGINQAWGQANQAQQGAYDRLASLGQQINNSILEQNLAKEAQEMAPVIGQEYQSAFQAIEQGDISGGLSRIYQTNAQVSRNPILARQSQEITKAAEMMSQDYMRNRLMTREQGFVDARAAAAQAGMNQRQEQGLENRKEFEQWKRGLDDDGNMTPAESTRRYKESVDYLDDLITLDKNLDEAKTPEDRKRIFGVAKEQLRLLAQRNPDINIEWQKEILPDDKIRKLKALEKAIGDAEEAVGKNYKPERHKGLIDKYKAEIQEIRASTEKFYLKHGADIRGQDPVAFEDPMAEEVANVNSVEPELPTKELSFGSEAEAESAFSQGKIKTGDTVVIGGKKFRIGQ